MDHIDTLMSELSSFNPVEHHRQQNSRLRTIAHAHELAENDINQYVLNKSKGLIEAGLETIEEIRPFVIQGQNPDEIAALSELISATTRAIEALNKINLQNKKAETDEKLKKIDIESKKEIAKLLPGNAQNTTNNVIVATREEILDKLFKDQPIELNEIEQTLVSQPKLVD